jgi:hypothetical protein
MTKEEFKSQQWGAGMVARAYSSCLEHVVTGVDFAEGAVELDEIKWVPYAHVTITSQGVPIPEMQNEKG